MLDPRLRQLSGAVLAAYYHLYFNRHKRPSRQAPDFIHALVEDLQGRSLCVQQLGEQRLAIRPVHLLVEDCVAVRVLMEPHLTQQRQDEMLRALKKHGWPVGVLINFGAHKPQLARLVRPP